MPSTKHAGLLVSSLGVLALFLSPAQAAMQSTADILGKTDRAQLITMLKREEVQQQLVEMGVDPSEAIARVGQMTEDEIVAMNQKIAELPAGAGAHVNIVQLLLLIIVILILV